MPLMRVAAFLLTVLSACVSADLTRETLRELVADGTISEAQSQALWAKAEPSSSTPLHASHGAVRGMQTEGNGNRARSSSGGDAAVDAGTRGAVGSISGEEVDGAPAVASEDGSTLSTSSAAVSTSADSASAAASSETVPAKATAGEATGDFKRALPDGKESKGEGEKEDKQRHRILSAWGDTYIHTLAYALGGTCLCTMCLLLGCSMNGTQVVVMSLASATLFALYLTWSPIILIFLLAFLPAAVVGMVTAVLFGMPTGAWFSWTGDLDVRSGFAAFNSLEPSAYHAVWVSAELWLFFALYGIYLSVQQQQLHIIQQQQQFAVDGVSGEGQVGGVGGGGEGGWYPGESGRTNYLPSFAFSDQPGGGSLRLTLHCLLVMTIVSILMFAASVTMVLSSFFPGALRTTFRWTCLAYYVSMLLLSSISGMEYAAALRYAALLSWIHLFYWSFLWACGKLARTGKHGSVAGAFSGGGARGGARGGGRNRRGGGSMAGAAGGSASNSPLGGGGGGGGGNIGFAGDHRQRPNGFAAAVRDAGLSAVVRWASLLDCVVNIAVAAHSWSSGTLACLPYTIVALITSLGVMNCK